MRERERERARKRERKRERERESEREREACLFGAVDGPLDIRLGPRARESPPIHLHYGFGFRGADVNHNHADRDYPPRKPYDHDKRGFEVDGLLDVCLGSRGLELPHVHLARGFGFRV